VAAFYDANDRVIAQFLEYPDLTLLLRQCRTRRRRAHDRLADLREGSNPRGTLRRLARELVRNHQIGGGGSRSAGQPAGVRDRPARQLADPAPEVSEHPTWYPHLASKLERLPAPTVDGSGQPQPGRLAPARRFECCPVSCRATEQLVGEPLLWTSVKSALAAGTMGLSPRFRRLAYGVYQVAIDGRCRSGARSPEEARAGIGQQDS